MKKKLSGIIAVAVITALCKSASAQEQVLPLSFNPVITEKKSPPPSSLRSAVPLPFFDDFSYLTIYPDPNLWVDRQAFVNVTFPLDPPSYGVATLDGLKENGQPYDSISHSFYSVGGADTLTSQMILLGDWSPADSVYLSFFFQAGGLGDPPNTQAYNLGNFSVGFGDSLVLEFKDNTDTVWHHAWAHDGTNSSQPFEQVLVPVKDSIFFHNDFQFRFRNYATRIGQFDCWNIDYVKLASGRNFHDTQLFDVAIQYMPTSILKNYQAMPWNQFQAYQNTEKATQQFVTARNNETGTQNVNFNRVAYEAVTATPLDPLISVSNNVSALSSFTKSFALFDIPDFPTDNVDVVTQFFIGGVANDNVHQNDSLNRHQIFSNVLAYDDGTPEGIYRLLGSPASLALQYHLNEPDSLQGVQILFAHTDVNLAPNLFNLYVWKDTTDVDTLIRDEFLTPQFENELNGFVFYRLSHSLLMDTGIFYIGWQQVSLQSDLKMDVGFDKNDTANQHLFYNVDGTWQQSAFPGAVMMRPVLGKAIPFQIGIPPVNSSSDFIVFPNPTTDVIYVRGGSNHLQLQAFDISGKAMTGVNENSQLETRNLPAGMYMLRITDLRNGKTSVQKFVKAE